MATKKMGLLYQPRSQENTADKLQLNTDNCKSIEEASSEFTEKCFQNSTSDNTRCGYPVHKMRDLALANTNLKAVLLPNGGFKAAARRALHGGHEIGAPD
ncbi:hypothetical protein CEXT_515911 [Caerostris extrusa]|uniref:Uncharacterized protein n=1 Tax=Caerostris extrusa TaxID=172846 RepID=A0AAV4UVP3_CAEEX|nr:hypothetical protein CEXT_515911 [Caerostris extrusa]